MKIPLSVFTASAALGIAFWFISSSPTMKPAADLPSPLPARAQSSHPSIPKKSAPFEFRADAIQKMPQDETRENALRELVSEWATRNPTAAENWAAALTDASEREMGLSHIVEVWAGSDPEAAIGMAQRNQLPSWILDDLVGQWATQDFPAALSWASEISPGIDSDEILSRIFLTRAQADPAAAAAFVAKRLPPGAVQEEAVMSVLHLWLPRDQAAASAWVAEFPEGPFRTRAEAEVQGFRTDS